MTAPLAQGPTDGAQSATVVPARPEHLEAVVRIWHDGWGDGHRGNVPDELVAHRTIDGFRRMATERRARTWVAVTANGAAGDAVGFVVVHHDEVDQLYVAAEWRGRGVAAALLDHAEALIGREHRVAWLAVVAGNQRARRFYERRGWQDAGGIDHHAETATGSIPVPARRYEKALTGSA